MVAVTVIVTEGIIHLGWNGAQYAPDLHYFSAVLTGHGPASVPCIHSVPQPCCRAHGLSDEGHGAVGGGLWAQAYGARG